jgi:hypothetical protein
VKRGATEGHTCKDQTRKTECTMCVRVRRRETEVAWREGGKMRVSVPRKLNRAVLAISYFDSFSVGKPTWHTTSPPKVSTPLVRLLVRMGLLASQREYIPAILK